MPEDWGWFTTVSVAGQSYLIGASYHLDEPDEQADDAPKPWVVQIHKDRTWMETLRGRNKLDEDDPLVAAIRSTLQSSGRFDQIEELGNA